MVRVDIQKPAWERTKRPGSPMRKNFDTRQTWKKQDYSMCDFELN